MHVLSSERIAEEHFRAGSSWPELIKALRGALRIDIYEAEVMALRHPGWRRWLNQHVNSNHQCRKQAQSHLKINGERSLLEWDGAVFSVREPNQS